MSDTPKQILRWLAVIPGAMLAGIVVLFPVHWLALFIHHFGGSEDSFITTADGKGLLQAMPLESLERFMDALFVPGTVIFAGARIAPRFRFATAIVVTVLLASTLIYGIARVGSSGTRFVDSPFRIAVTIILWLASVIFALFQAREIDKAA